MIELIKKVITENTKVVEQVKAGKDKAINMLVGKVMSVMKTSDPAVVMRMLRDEIGVSQHVRAPKVVEQKIILVHSLSVLDIKHEGGTLYKLISGNEVITFTTKDVVEGKDFIPDEIRKYIIDQLI